MVEYYTKEAEKATRAQARNVIKLRRFYAITDLFFNSIALS